MKGIKLPATIRWAITNCLLIWFAMSLYRGFLLGIFLDGNPSGFLAIFSGMVVDAGVLSLMLVLYLLLGLLPSLHPFKSRKGKLFGYIYFIFWGMLIALIYALDLIFVKTIHYRMYGSKLLQIFEDPNETEIFFKNVSFTPFLLIIVLILWIWGILIVKLHSYVARLSRVHSKTTRMTWQGWVIVTCVVLGGFAFFQGNQVSSSKLNLKSAPYLSLKANPVLSLFLV